MPAKKTGNQRNTTKKTKPTPKRTDIPKQSGRQRQLDAIRPHQWRKGVSGNPRGRPKGPSFATIARQLLNEPVLGRDGQPLIGPDGEPITRLHALAEAVIRRALKGSSTDLIELLARIDPKPKQGSADAVLDIQVGIGSTREVDPYEPPLGVDRLRELPRGNNGDAG